MNGCHVFSSNMHCLIVIFNQSQASVVSNFYAMDNTELLKRLLWNPSGGLVFEFYHGLMQVSQPFMTYCHLWKQPAQYTKHMHTCDSAVGGTISRSLEATTVCMSLDTSFMFLLPYLISC